MITPCCTPIESLSSWMNVFITTASFDGFHNYILPLYSDLHLCCFHFFDFYLLRLYSCFFVDLQNMFYFYTYMGLVHVTCNFKCIVCFICFYMLFCFNLWVLCTHSCIGLYMQHFVYCFAWGGCVVGWVVFHHFHVLFLLIFCYINVIVLTMLAASIDAFLLFWQPAAS